MQDAAERGVPVPTVAAALDARYVSAARGTRQACNAALAPPDLHANARLAPPAIAETGDLVSQLERALYCGKLCAYAQGLSLIATAAAAEGWPVDLASCARTWSGGCIIRAALLALVHEAYRADAELPNLLLAPAVAAALAERQAAWRAALAKAGAAGVPMSASAASLAYATTRARRRARRRGDQADAPRRLRRPALLLSGTTTRCATHACRAPRSSRRSATASAGTRTSASTRTAPSTPNGPARERKTARARSAAAAEGARFALRFAQIGGSNTRGARSRRARPGFACST